MGKYRIVWMYDEHDCEICGWSAESGYIIYKDDDVVVDAKPIAHCFDSVGYDTEKAFLDILKLEGIEVEQEEKDK